ncbi:MAG: histidine kinase [Rhizobium sp.]|nr:histidine kinase [Rhizobium sp.]
MGFAAVARVTDDRWIACSVLDEIDFGLKPGGELKVETTICHEIRGHLDTVAIDNVAEDAVYCGHPTPALYGFQSYISTPILLADGSFFGTLCAIDPKPARVNNHQTIGTLKLFAELIARHIDAARELASSEAKLNDERASAELRELFIAVLGHDLRNPLASIQAGTKRIARFSDNEQVRMTVGLMQKSVDRMANLIENVMDFARGRLGDGIHLRRSGEEPLEPVLTQVIEELRVSWPERRIDTNFRFTRTIDCDRDRLGQLFSNLLGNALTHGAQDGTVRVHAATEGDEFILSVANPGRPIPEARREQLFKPFSHDSGSGKQGLGLGLYIASEIAIAHGGELSVTSTPEETRFIFRMPIVNHQS